MFLGSSRLHRMSKKVKDNISISVSGRLFTEDIKSDIGVHISLSNVSSNHKEYNLFYKDIQPKTEKTGTAPVTVFLHNATGCLHDVNSVAIPDSHRIITYDRIGHGESGDYVENNPNIDMFDNGVFELFSLLDRLKISECSLVGHSDGATIALLAAIASALNHGLFCNITSVVALAPHVRQEDETLPAIESYIAKNCVSGSKFDNYLRHHGNKKDNVIARWKKMWSGPLYEWDILDVMSEVEIPTLLIAGDKDPYFPKEQYVEIGQKLKNCDLQMIEGAAHSPQTELSSQELVKNLITTFLTKHNSTQSDSSKY